MRLLRNLMKEKYKENLILVLIFLLVLASRLYFVFQTPYFNNDGYLNYGLVSHISETGKPLLFDQLSYNGRDLLYSPLFHYILAFFDLFLPLDFVLKVIPSIFISLLVFVVYSLSFIFVKDKNLSLFIALLSGFVPIVFIKTLNNISVYTLVLPLTFYLLYLLIKIKEKGNLNKFVIFCFFLALLHPSAFLFLITLSFFIILSVNEDFNTDKLKKEVILLSLCIILFIEFLIYKKAFIAHGIDVVRTNVPVQFLTSYFNLDLLGDISKVGALIIVFGLSGIILGWKKKQEEIFLLSSLILATLILLGLRLIRPDIGLMFLSIALVIFSGITFQVILKYFDITKFSKYKKLFTSIFVLILIASLILPTFLGAANNITYETPTEYELLVLNWIKENALPDVTVLAPIEKGYVITVIANKRNVIDSNFLLAPDTSERFKDVTTIYSTKSEVEALELLNKHNVDYIFVPVEAEIKFGKVTWLNDKSCFEGLFFGTPEIYKIICK